jgi:Uma2 family endonuclease
MSSTAVRPRRADRAVEPFYPESDGKPMGETDLHIEITTYLREALKVWFRDVSGHVYVSGNTMTYYVEGDPRVSISPDVFVVKGAPQRRRRVYKFWEEPAPCVVIEVSSRKTKLDDLRTKFEVYRDTLKVREYYIYDPERDYLPQRLRGWILRGAGYVERRLVKDRTREARRVSDSEHQHQSAGGGSSFRMRSRELGLDLVDDHGFLRLMDPRTGLPLPGLPESEEARRRAVAERDESEAARREAEAARRESEAELERLREENRRLRGASPRLRRRAR